MSAFPQVPLDLKIEMSPGSLGWTDITSDALQREGTAPAAVITRGRPEETSQASPAQAAFQLKNPAGKYTVRNPSGAFYGQLNRNTPLRISVPDAGTYLRIEDDTASFSSAPGSGVLPSGAVDIDVRMDLALSGWSPCTLMSWWGGSGERGWLLTLNGDGTLTFSWTTGGTTATLIQATSTRPLPLTPGCLRVTLAHTAGVVTFYTGAAGAIAGSTWTQLGAAAGPGSATTIFASTAAFSVGYNATADSDFSGLPGLTGKVNDALVMSGIAGTVKAQAAFTSQTAGAATWTDAESNVWTLGGTAVLSSRSYRFHGEMSSLPTAWDPSGKDVWTALTANGPLRRVQAGSATLPSAIRRAGTLADGIVAAWPCEDGAGATQIASALPGGPAMQIDGKPALAADSSFACSGPLPQMNGASFTGAVPGYSPTGTNAVRFLARVLPDAGATSGFALAQIKTTGVMAQLIVFYDPADNFGDPADFGVEAYDATGNTLSRTPSFSIDNSGGDFLISVEVTSSGGNVTLTLRALDTSGRVSSASSSSLAGAAGAVTSVTLNPARTADTTLAQTTDATVLGQLVVQSAAGSFAGDWTGPVTAWNGEAAGTRFARLCSENGYASRIAGYPESTAAMGTQGQATLGTLLQECESADRGMIFEPRQALALGYRTVGSMYNQDPAASFDYALKHLGQAGQPGEWAPTDDDQQIVNDVTATRGSSGGSQGSAYTAQLDDGSALSVSSPAEGGVGDYPGQVTVNVQTDGQLADVANWMVHVGTTNEQRIPSLPLNLARSALSALKYDVQDADIGDRVIVANPPAWLPPDDVTQIITGTTEQLGGTWYLLAWNTVPELPYEVAVCGDGVLGRGDTAGSQLTSPVGVSDTSFQVTTTAGQSWTADSALFTVAGTYSVLPPFGIFAMNAQAVAAGGGGGGSNTSTTKGGGGGGGESAAEPSLAVIPNIPVAVVVGAAGALSGTGTGGTGGSTTIAGTSVTVTAHGGTGGGTAGTAGTGGTGSANTTHHNGGAGGSSPSSGDGGGSGGGSGGTASAGNAGTSATSAAATAGAVAVTGGGPGGNGGAHSLPGSAPASGPGGGGGGAGGNLGGNSGAGADGQALLSWTSADFPMDIIIGGERMTVAHIQGQGVTQLFSGVTRSVNGVVKSHLAGEAVSIVTPAVAAL